LAYIDKNKYDKLKTLAQILKEARESESLLLRQVAAAVNADTAMISKFEKGERKPTREQIGLLAKVLKLDEKALLISYLSDKVASDLAGEDVAKEALKAAEKKIDILKKKQDK
jgi:transcriptional regulator with XRE-family HTH domain